MTEIIRPYTGPDHTDLRPDADTILRQMTFWFGDMLSGQIDIGWFEAGTGKLNRFRRFDLHQLEDLSEYACGVNAIPGQSIYFRPALVRADAPPRVRDEHFERATGVWCDLDQPGAAENVRSVCPTAGPNMVVVTGRQPHLRAQLFWRLSDPIMGGDTVKEVNGRAWALFAGDRAAVNPTRLMRIAGTIAWPWKPGRVPELTELLLFDDRPRSYPLLALTRTFPEGVSTGTPPTIPGRPGSTSLFPERATVSELIRRIRAGGGGWHDDTLRLVARLVGLGRFDEEILAIGQSLTLPGYTAAQTRDEIATMIRGARDKWGAPEPPETGDRPVEIAATPFSLRDPSTIPPRRWLYDRHLIAGFVSLTVSPGGLGKSSLALVEALAMVTRLPLLGAVPPRPLRVWYWCGEDPRDEIERRVAAVCIHYGISREDIDGRLFTDSGRDVPIEFAAMGRDGTVVARPVVDAMIAAIGNAGIDVFMADPFVTTHAVAENDNGAINRVVSLWREIADRTGCAVALVHHSNKGALSAPAEIGIAQARGASALVDGVRSARFLVPMSEDEATKAGIGSHRGIFRVEVGKSNLAPRPERATWRGITSVALGNGSDLYPEGDQVGVVTVWHWPDVFEGIDDSAIARVQRLVADGSARESEQSTKWVGHLVGEVLGLDPGGRQGRSREQNAARTRIKAILSTWIANGALQRELRHSKRDGREVPYIVAGDLHPSVETGRTA